MLSPRIDDAEHRRVIVCPGHRFHLSYAVFRVASAARSIKTSPLSGKIIFLEESVDGRRGLSCPDRRPYDYRVISIRVKVIRFELWRRALDSVFAAEESADLARRVRFDRFQLN